MPTARTARGLPAACLNSSLTRGEQLRVQAGMLNGSLRLLGVGRLVEKKGFDVFVEACAELRRRDIWFASRACFSQPLA